MKKRIKNLAVLSLMIALFAQIFIMIFFKNGTVNLLLNLLSLLAIVFAIFFGIHSATYVEKPRQGEDWKNIIEEEAEKDEMKDLEKK